MYYFAYGSNMNTERMTSRGVNFTTRQHAILTGYDLKFNKMASRNPKEGYANIMPEENGIVEGALYDVNKEGIAKLDKCEGCPLHYSRKEVRVKIQDGEEVVAITYVAQPDKVTEGLKPTTEYFDHLLSGKDILTEKYYSRLKLVSSIYL